MLTHWFRSNSGRRWIAAGVAGLLGLPGAGTAEPSLPSPYAAVRQPGAAPEALPEPEPAAAAGLSLDECIAIALQRQPRLDAYRASLESARIAYKALAETQCLRSLLAPDLEYRREQSLRGIAAAEAELAQAEWEVVYDVTRTYYTAVYAREQLKVAGGVIGNLKHYLALVRDLVETGATRELTQSTVDKLTVYLGMAETKQAEAALGVERARAALAEAMGLDPAHPPAVADVPLPFVPIELSKEAVIAAAVERRGEVIQAGLAAEAFRLEVCAQDAIRFRPLTRTLASGSDLHSRPIPTGSRGAEYVPEAVGPEMPPSLFGRRSDRVARAAALSGRAGAVFEKTRNLVALEAANGYLRWAEATRKVRAARAAYDAARRLSKRTREDVELGIKREEILTNEVIAGQAQSAYNEAVFQHVLALADLERITAGAVRIPWQAAAPPPPPDANDQGPKPPPNAPPPKPSP